MKRLREVYPALLVALRTLVRGACPSATIGYLINYPDDAAMDCRVLHRPCGYHA